MNIVSSSVDCKIKINVSVGVKNYLKNKSVIKDLFGILVIVIVNIIYLVFNDLDAYIEKGGKNKYLIFASTDKNEMVLDYTEI